MSQPFFVAETFTGALGKYVTLKDTTRAFKGIVEGEYDHLPEQAFYMVGGIEEAAAKGAAISKTEAKKEAASAMTRTIRCDVVSAHWEIFSGEVLMVFATGVAGEPGISPRHAPLITQLKPGPVWVLDTAGAEQFFFVGGGIIEVQPHVVTVMADTAMRGEDLDQAAAEAAKADAERAIADRTGEMDIAQAQAKLAEAVAQLQAMEQLRKKLRR